MAKYAVEYEISHPDGYVSNNRKEVDDSTLSMTEQMIRDCGGNVIGVHLIDGKDEQDVKFQESEQDESYNGWANRETWNVALWINNTESLYRMAVEYVKSKKHKSEVRYSQFASMFNLNYRKTGDDVKYNDNKLNLRQLNDMLREMWEDFNEERN